MVKSKTDQRNKSKAARKPVLTEIPVPMGAEEEVAEEKSGGFEDSSEHETRGPEETLGSFVRACAESYAERSSSSTSFDSQISDFTSLLFYQPCEFVEEKIILLSKMRLHYHALAFLIGVIGDLQAAENYVVTYYSGGVEEFVPASEPVRKKSDLAGEDSRFNDERFLHTTMIVLMLRFSKTEHLTYYLCKFYRFLSLRLILRSFIPSSLSLAYLEPFLTLAFRSLSARRMNSILSLNLLKAEMLIKEVHFCFGFLLGFFYFLLRKVAVRSEVASLK
jgi:hypothetical protein